MCKVSIIVPMYNGEKTIARCLESLINQELQDLEILVIDDGSKDDSEIIVRSFLEKDSRIRLISQRNQGQGAARNRGIRESEGKYVGFVDCDDFVHPSMFQIMFDALEKTGASVAICQEKNVFLENGEIQPISETTFRIKENTVFSAEMLLKWQINFIYLSFNSMCYKVVERKVFIEQSIWFPEQHRYAEDFVTSVGVFSKIDFGVLIPETLYYYVHEKESFTYSYSLKHAEDVFQDWLEAMAYIKKCGYKLNTDNFSLGMCFASLKQVYWANEKKEKKTERFKKLIDSWEINRKEQGWKPDFSEIDMPFMHKIKVIVAYFRLCRPVLAGMKLLTWIPLFKYLT